MHAGYRRDSSLRIDGIATRRDRGTFMWSAIFGEDAVKQD